MVTDKIKTSILKGIEQYYSTVNQLLQSNFIDIQNKENYLFIVTYKDLYLGNGKDSLDNIAKEKYQSIQEKYPACSLLKNDNMYFISVDDFDLLVELLLTKTKTLTEILQFAVESDKNYKTKKFDFRQHIAEINNDINNVSYLKEEFDKIANSCANKLNYS